MLQVSLKVVGGSHDGEVIPLADPKFLIGRESDCHLRPNSEAISRHHCAFAIDDYAVRLRDLGSTNGTFVNGERLRGVATLASGDTVTVGKLEFVVSIGDEAEEAPAPAETPLSSETAELSSDETAYELPTMPPTQQAAPQESDTTMMPAQNAPAQQPQQPQPAAGVPQPYPQQMPPGMPFQYPQQPGYFPQGMPYPGQPPMGGGYPQYPYPYPQPVVMGQPYPQQQPGYPQGMPEQQPAAQAPAEEAALPDVRLPDPAETGAKAAPAPAPPTGDEGTPPPVEEKNPSQHAADIIRGHLHRRPE